MQRIEIMKVVECIDPQAGDDGSMLVEIEDCIKCEHCRGHDDNTIDCDFEDEED